jgi:hypothetical protein
MTGSGECPMAVVVIDVDNKSGKLETQSQLGFAMSRCQCVFPDASEQELATVPGDEPGTAWRVYVCPAADGYVRVQQLGHDEKLGWYVQKSMALPREVLAALVPQLRKALCLMPGATAKTQATAAVDYMRIVADGEAA